MSSRLKQLQGVRGRYMSVVSMFDFDPRPCPQKRWLRLLRRPSCKWSVTTRYLNHLVTQSDRGSYRAWLCRGVCLNCAAFRLPKS